VPTIAPISDVTNGSKSPSKVPAYLHPDYQFDDRATGRTNGLNSSLPADRCSSMEFERNEKPGFLGCEIFESAEAESERSVL